MTTGKHIVDSDRPRQNLYAEMRGFCKGSLVTSLAITAFALFSSAQNERVGDFPDATAFVDTLQPCAEGQFVWETFDGEPGLPVDDRCAIDSASGGVNVYSQPTNQILGPSIKLPRGAVVIPICTEKGSAIKNVDGDSESTWIYVSLDNTPPVYENFSKDGALKGYIPEDSVVGDTSVIIPACTPDTQTA